MDVWAASNFNQPIGAWNTANVIDMNNMFSGAEAFNQPIGTWNTANVTDMNNMFSNATAFNQPIGTWNTAKVTNMERMFSSATVFNQPIGSWETGNVINMVAMFMDAKSFNQVLDNWNVSKDTSVNNMFRRASAFNQSLATWNLASIPNNNNTSMDKMLSETAVSCINYAKTLIGWTDASQGSGWALSKTNVTFGANLLQYAPEASAARNLLIANGWTIEDSGVGTCVLSVGFGNLSAFIENGKLIINWNTISETDNDKFIIEVSKTGIDNWKKVAEVKSKATNGNSLENIDYTTQLDLQNALAVLATLMFLGFLVPGISKRRRIVLAILAISITVGYFSCKKSDFVKDVNVGEKIFVRLSQVDKNGTTKVLMIKEAVRK